VSIDGAEYSRRETDAAFRILKGMAGIYSRAFHRTRLVRPCRLPKTGPAILVCNHVSSIDPILLQSFSPRLVRWMMAKEYFDYKSIRWLYETMGVILVQRSGRDQAATRAAMRVLASGYVLGVFPEGRLETTRDLIPFQRGIGLLAVKTRAPVHPAFVDGTQRNREMVEAVVTPSVASVAFAPPLDFADLTDSRAGVLEATRRIQAAVEALKSGSEI
jgi:1-acyl-sn-glycerol-3-phosphate acyltransferase